MLTAAELAILEEGTARAQIRSGAITRARTLLEPYSKGGTDLIPDILARMPTDQADEGRWLLRLAEAMAPDPEAVELANAVLEDKAAREQA